MPSALLCFPHPALTGSMPSIGCFLNPAVSSLLQAVREDVVDLTLSDDDDDDGAEGNAAPAPKPSARPQAAARKRPAARRPAATEAAAAGAGGQPRAVVEGLAVLAFGVCQGVSTPRLGCCTSDCLALHCCGSPFVTYLFASPALADPGNVAHSKILHPVTQNQPSN